MSCCVISLKIPEGVDVQDRHTITPLKSELRQACGQSRDAPGNFSISEPGIAVPDGQSVRIIATGPWQNVRD
jgi:hypothetical protein